MTGGKCGNRVTQLRLCSPQGELHAGSIDRDSKHHLCLKEEEKKMKDRENEGEWY